MRKLIQTIRQRLFPSRQPDEPIIRDYADPQPSTPSSSISADTGGGMFNTGTISADGHVIGRDYIINHSKPDPKPDPSPATAPSPTSDFVGRTAELDQLTNLLISGHSAAITALQGMGGIGKTELARKLVAHLNEQQPVHFSGGIFWASLELHSGSADPILRDWAAYCGVDLPQELTPDQLQGRVRGALTQRQQQEGHLLAVLDDVRPEWEATAHLLRQTLPAGMPLLITTREQHLADALKAQVVPLDLLPTADGVTLLANIIQQPALLQDEALIDELLEELGNLPLAIRLAATYIRNFSTKPGWTLAGFVDQLRAQALKLLDTQGAERGLAATFAISYGTLTPQQQHLFGLASIYSPPLLTVENIAGLLGPENDLDGTTLEAELNQLVFMALLDWHKTIPGRYTLHPLLGQYAYDCLQGAVDDVRVIHAQAAHFLQAKVESDDGTPDERLEEVDQWEKACRWEEMARRADALVGTLDRLGYWPEIDQRLAAALAGLDMLGEDQLIKLKGYLMNSRGIIANSRAEWDKAITYYQQSLATFEQVGDSHGMATTYNNLGLVYKAKGEWDKAITYYQQSLATFEQVGDSHGMAQTYNNLGNVYKAKGEWDKAITYYQQSLATLEQVGDSHGMAATYNNLGLVYDSKGEWDKAITYYQQSLATKEQVGDSHGRAQTYNNLGAVYQAKGEWDKAITYYQQSLATFEQVGDSHGMAQTYNNLGLVYQDKGEWDKAITYYQQDLEISEQVGDSHGMATTWMNLGNVYQAKGEWDKAITYYQQSLATLEQVGDSHGMATTQTNIGFLLLAQNQHTQAQGLFAQALFVFTKMGAPEAQTARAGLVQACGSVEAADAYLAEMVAGG